MYILTQKNIDNIVNNELQEDINVIKTHYKLLLSMQKTIAFATYKDILTHTDVTTLLDTSVSKDAQKKNRTKLYMQALEEYKSAQKQGVLQIQFVDKKNISFLRMHKRDKFGDDLTGIREDYMYTNTTLKPIQIFTQGRTSNGFRNVFPIYKDDQHIGAMEISFSSLDTVEHLNEITYTNASLLIHKKTQEKKAWSENYLPINYIQSIENRDFLVAEVFFRDKKKYLATMALKKKRTRAKIVSKMSEEKPFSSYVKDEDSTIIYAFLPLYNLEAKTVAWFVSYTDSPTIYSILLSSKIIRFFVFIISLILCYFAIRQIKAEAEIQKLTFDVLHQVELFTNNVMAWESDAQGNLTFITQSLLSTSGYEQWELLGRPYSKLHTTSTDFEIYKEISETLKSGNTWKGDYKYSFKNGGFYWLRCTIYPKYNEKDIFIGYQAILHSIEAEKSKEQFLANMSHEIRTPLNAIMGFIKLLKEEHINLHYLDIIDNSSKSLLKIINDILDFSKIESGKLDVEYHDFDPTNEFNATRDLFSAKCSEKSIQLHTDFQNISNPLYGDSLRIKQVLNNLLSNAIKFTPKNKNIYLSIKYENNSLYISIRDEGIGISNEYQKTIFESFTQADISTTRKYGGTGLGLSISSSLVKLMGGELKVKSQVDEGSTFYFSLPLKLGKPIPKQKNIENKVDFSHLKTLLVEDNKSNQLFMRVLFKKINIKFDIANDGLEAIEQFKNNKYDFILMDENMPNMNGMKATKEILRYEKKKKLIHTPIIALTANAFRGDKEKFLKAGMDWYLTKPLDKEVLISTIINILKK